jgi:hypothetical protein
MHRKRIGFCHSDAASGRKPDQSLHIATYPAGFGLESLVDQQQEIPGIR